MRGSSSRAMNCFQPRAPLRERTLAQVFLAFDQKIVGAQMRGKFRQQLGVDGFAVEPLLQHVEALHAAVAHDQELAVDRAGQPQGIRSGRGSCPKYPRRCANRAAQRAAAVLAGARDGLDADAVPFPFRKEVFRRRAQRDRHPRSRARASQDGRARDRGLPACRHGLRARRTIRHRAAAGPARSARSPAGRCRRARRRRSWRVVRRRRCASAPVTSLSSAQRPVSSSRSSQRASCAGSSDLPREERAVITVDRVNSSLLRRMRVACRPHQRDGLGQVADIVVGQLEQHRIGALGDQRADHARLGVLERERAGERRQCPAAFGIGGRCGNSPSSAAACCCGWARRRGGRAIRRSDSWRLACRLHHRSRPRRRSRRCRAAAPAAHASRSSARARPPAHA